jgi:hypothetical protein
VREKYCWLVADKPSDQGAEDWEDGTPVQIMKQLASSRRIDLQQLIN